MTSPMHSPLQSPLQPAMRSPLEFRRRGGGLSPDEAILSLFGSRLAWMYSAASTETLGTTSAGAGAVADGDPIGYIGDISPTGLTLTQPVSDKRIKLGVNSSGNPCFHFDGTKTIFLESASTSALVGEDNLSVFFAGELSDTASNNGAFIFSPSGVSGSFKCIGSAVATYQKGLNQQNVIYGADLKTPRVYELKLEPSARRTEETVRLEIDGVGPGNVKGSSVDIPGETSSFISGSLRFGAWISGWSWEGNITAFLAIRGKLTDSERAAVLSYLANSSGASVAMPYVPLRHSHAGSYLALDSSIGKGFAVSSYAALYYDTSATEVTLDIYCDNIISGYVDIGVYIDGSYYTKHTPAASGAATVTISLPSGAKRVGLINSAMSNTGAGLYATGTRINAVRFNSSSTLYDFPKTGRILIYGDSVATGGHGSPIVQNAYALKLRAETGIDVCVYAESGRAFKADYDNTTISGNKRDPFVETVYGYAPSILWMAMGVNDYGQEGWTASAFGTAYAATLDELHTALPSLQIYAQSPLNPTHGATANALGDTLQDYCDAIETACVGRAWVTYVDGATIITSPGTELTDGVHPNNAGNATYAAFIRSELGI